MPTFVIDLLEPVVDELPAELLDELPAEHPTNMDATKVAAIIVANSLFFIKLSP
jgi:hypothetical protein